MSNFDNVEAKAFQDPESGMIYEIYPIEQGKSVVFNLDGEPFKFECFIMVMSRMEELIQGLFIFTPKVAAEELIKIGQMVKLPYPVEELEQAGDLAVRFDINQEALDRFINPNFSKVKDLKEFFDIKDDIGGSVILDFFYYNITHIENPYEKLIKATPNISSEDD